MKTPRTDAVMAQINTHPQPETIVDLARELELENATLREDKARLDWLDAHCEVTISTADEGADMVGFNATLNPATAGKLRNLIDQAKLTHP